MKRNDYFNSIQDFDTMRTALGRAVENSHPSKQPEALQMRKIAARRELAASVLHTTLAIADLALMPLIDVTEAHAQQAQQHREEFDALPQHRTIGQIATRTERGEGTIVHPNWVR